MGFSDQVRAGIRSAFTVENLVNQGITYGLTIMVTLYFGIRYELPCWAWALVALSMLLAVGAVVLMVRKPKLESPLRPNPPPFELKPLWGPGGDPATLDDHDLRAEAGRLAKEIRRFREQHAKALPPLEWVVVPGDPEKVDAFNESREQDAIATYRASFQGRVGAVFEELVRRRGYGHPMMDGRWNNIRMAGEIDTVARGLEDMSNPEPEGPPPPLRKADDRRIQVLMTRAATPDTNIDPDDTTNSGWRSGTPEGYGWQVVRGTVILRPPEGEFGSRRAAENDARKYQGENRDLDDVPIEHI